MPVDGSMCVRNDNARMPSGSSTDTAVPGHFRPRLILQTLTRGDGLLGLRAVPGFGPRSTQQR
jgi:hypothetical protein